MLIMFLESILEFDIVNKKKVFGKDLTSGNSCIFVVFIRIRYVLV